jgi:crotonobetaine/carnitine-CoA ligase
MAEATMRIRSPLEQVILQRVSDHPAQTWLKWQDSRYTWAEALSNIRRAANGFLELGVQPGERVAIMMPNRPEFLWAHFGLTFMGGISVPVNISQRGPVLSHILRDSGAVAVVLQDDLQEALTAVRGDLAALRTAVVLGRKTGSSDEDFERLMASSDADPDVTIPGGAAGGGMMYTSGTTGPPKGVVTTKGDWTPIARLLDASGVQPGETMYTSLPLYHGNALGVSTVGSIMLDAKLALAPRFSASRFWDDCRRFEAVEFNTLGGMISILLKQPSDGRDRDHAVRIVLSAGCPPDRWDQFEQRFGVRIIEWFGMVDSPGILLNDVGKRGSMGRSGVAGVEFAVVGEDGRPLGPGQVGELVFRHPGGRMTHYQNLPEATEHAYRGGWFHSGDLASYDADGFFYYRGRKKESMRRLGENISAWEIESVLNAHPAVLETAAHAVPSELGEDEIKACVVLRPGAVLTAEELLNFCQGQLAYFAVPRYVEFMAELPKTATQRNQYGVLKARGIAPGTWDRAASGYRVKRT